MILIITILLAVLLLVICLKTGYKIGFVKGLSNIICLGVSILVLLLTTMVYSGVSDGKPLNSIFSVILLSILGIVYFVIRALSKTAGFISHLPVIGSLNKILGLITGLVWYVLLLYGMYILNGKTQLL